MNFFSKGLSPKDRPTAHLRLERGAKESAKKHHSGVQQFFFQCEFVNTHMNCTIFTDCRLHSKLGCLNYCLAFLGALSFLCMFLCLFACTQHCWMIALLFWRVSIFLPFYCVNCFFVLFFLQWLGEYSGMPLPHWPCVRLRKDTQEFDPPVLVPLHLNCVDICFAGSRFRPEDPNRAPQGFGGIAMRAKRNDWQLTNCCLTAQAIAFLRVGLLLELLEKVFF